MSKPADPETVRKGDVVAFGSSRLTYRVQWWEEHDGGLWLVCHGPLASNLQQGGQAFYVGPKPGRRPDPLTGKRCRLDPRPVRIVETKRR